LDSEPVSALLDNAMVPPIRRSCVERGKRDQDFRSHQRTIPPHRLPWHGVEECAFLETRRILWCRPRVLEGAMSLGLILIILVIIYLLGGFSGRFGGYGYGMGHSGIGIGGVILVVLIVLLLLGKL